MNISKDLIIILLIALLIFGPSRVSGLGSVLGKMVRDFRNAVDNHDGERTQPRSSEQNPNGRARRDAGGTQDDGA
jgi:TatA/E family protein of Tat protein translocase